MLLDALDILHTHKQRSLFSDNCCKGHSIKICLADLKEMINAAWFYSCLPHPRTTLSKSSFHNV